MADLPEDERAYVDKQIASLGKLVGALSVAVSEPGATIAVDGRIVGESPLAKPLRVSIGSRSVRVTKNGFEPFETFVEVAGRHTTTMRAELRPLSQSGWLKIDEANDKKLEVLVDGLLVGRTPFRGLVPPGEHLVVLRGEGRLGTLPTRVTVQLNQVTPLLLIAEELTSMLRVWPTPTDANVIVDGIAVGRGRYAGALRPGPHRVEVSAEGFTTRVESIETVEGATQTAEIVLELPSGARSGPLSLAATHRILEPIAKALRRAHEVGLVHRDLKPGNIFIARSGADEIVKVLDFGIAKDVDPKNRVLTDSGALIGSPLYMSPEQVREAKQIDHRSDLWSLGIILYEALTGQTPFHEHDNVGSLLVAICTETWALPSTIVPSLDPEVDQFFLRALAREPSERFQSATEMLEGFALLSGVPLPEPSLRLGLGRKEPASSATDPRANRPAAPDDDESSPALRSATTNGAAVLTSPPRAQPSCRGRRSLRKPGASSVSDLSRSSGLSPHSSSEA